MNNMTKLALLRPKLNLCSTELSIVETVKKFCNSYLQDIANNNGSVEQTREIYKNFGKMGLLGPTIPCYGLGTSYKMYGLMAKEIESVDSGFRSMFSVQSSLVANPIYQYGTDTVKDSYLPGLLSGELIGSFGLTEPDAGSDASTMKTTCRYKNGNYILNGSKTWITNSPVADVFVVWAKNEDGVSGFVLDRNMKGIDTPEIKGKMSLKSSMTGMIFLDNVVVPESHKLEVKGMKGPLSCLNNARLGISFGVLGAAEKCIETALCYAQDRSMFNSVLASKQLFQSKLVDMVTEYNLGLLAALNVADHKDNDTITPDMISLLKRNNCNKCLNIVRECRDILGGNGITEEYNIFRHVVNLETVKTYEGTHDVHTLIVGSSLSGHNAF